jgi:serum/glucocorticoid-regulated kinase 2
VLALEYLHKE